MHHPSSTIIITHHIIIIHHTRIFRSYRVWGESVGRAFSLGNLVQYSLSSSLVMLGEELNELHVNQ
jgi:hypothetical protein